MRQGDGVSVPFRRSSARPARGIPREEFVEFVDDAPTKKIELSDLVATQPTVDPDEVAWFVDNPAFRAPVGTRNKFGLLIDLPLVVQRGGQELIHDGHHRLSAAVVRGEQTAEVRYLDLDLDGPALARWARG